MAKRKASISIYLALTLMIIMALILSMLEAAQRAASGSYATMLLKMAEESLLGEYYGPLCEDYHLFGLDTGFGTTSGSIEELTGRLETYMGENVWDFQCDSCRVTDYDSFFANGGQTYIEQAVAYEKYASVGQLAEKILDSAGAFSDYGKTMKIFERSVPIEEKLAEIDKLTLEMMEVVDGIVISEWDPSDASKCASSENFAKKIFISEITQETTGINNPVLFSAIKGKYVNPLTVLKDAENSVVTLKELRETDSVSNSEMEAKKNEITDLEKSVKSIEKQLKSEEKEKKSLEKSIRKLRNEKDKDELNSQKNKLNETERKIKELEAELDEKNKLLDKCKEEYEQKKTEKDYAESRINSIEEALVKAMKLFDSIFEGEKESTEKALEILDEIDEKREKVRPMLTEYEAFLNTFDGTVTGETMSDLKETLEDMKGYVDDDSGDGRIADYDSMRYSLNRNLQLLNQIPDDFFDKDTIKDSTRLGTAAQTLSDISSLVASLKYDGMYFDYSGLCERSSLEEYDALLSGWFAGGIAKLIFGDEEISKNILSSNFLPTGYFEVQEPSNEEASMMNGESGLAPMQLLDVVKEETGFFCMIGDKIDEAGEEIVESLYLEMYQNENFKSYTSNDSKGDTVLEYEMEYILAGTHADVANLLAAAYKIFMARLAVDCIYVLCSREKMKEAETVAVTLLTFADSVPFLEKIVAIVIALIMAFAQALVETRAIIEGKSIAVIPTGDSFCIHAVELPFIASIVAEKADAVKDSDFGLKYDEYLMLFLLFSDINEQAARAMDLIQENIRYRYDEDFLLKNCITGFSAEASFSSGNSYVSIFDSVFNVLELDGLRTYAAEGIHY